MMTKEDYIEFREVLKNVRKQIKHPNPAVCQYAISLIKLIEQGTMNILEKDNPQLEWDWFLTLPNINKE